MTEFFKKAWTWFRSHNDKFQRSVLCLIIGMFIGGLVCRTWRQNVVDAPAGYSFGWDDKPTYVDNLVRTFSKPFFSDAGKNLVQGDTDKDAFLWKAYEQVHQHPWKAHDQNGTGCCVGEGFSTAVEILTAVGIAINGDANEYKDISASAVYALSREIGDFLGNQDGSTGADAAKSLQDLGVVSCEDAKDDNTTGRAHGAIAKKWGRTGLPSDLKKIAADHKVKTVSRVRTPEEVRAALVSGYPVPICSSVGFEGGGGFRRDAQGFCKMGGSWPHCMCVVGYRKDLKSFLVFQSWGESMPPGPKSLDQPNCSFWIDWKAMQRIVQTGECYAISSFDGFKARDLPLFIQAPLQRDTYVAVAGPGSHDQFCLDLRRAVGLSPNPMKSIRRAFDFTLAP